MATPDHPLAMYRRLDRAHRAATRANRELSNVVVALRTNKRCMEDEEDRVKHQRVLLEREFVDLGLAQNFAALKDAWIPLSTLVAAKRCLVPGCTESPAYMCVYDTKEQMCAACFVNGSADSNEEIAKRIRQDTDHMKEHDPFALLRRADEYRETATEAYHRAVFDPDRFDQWRRIQHKTAPPCIGGHPSDAAIDDDVRHVLVGQPSVVLCDGCHANRSKNGVVKRAVQNRIEEHIGGKVEFINE